MMKSLRSSGRVPALFAVLFCIVFGLLHILNVHPIGDGLWFWYATLFRQGHKLYRDMHLNLPPFFVLVTALNQAVFGTSWLAGKIPAVLQLLAYVTGLYLVSLFAPVRAWTRALLISAAFFLTIAISFARFDDYHIPTYITIVYSAWLLLRHYNNQAPRSEWVLAILLAALGGVSLGNRLNDGLLLVAAQGALLPFFARRRRIAATALFVLAAPSFLLLLVLLTGDTPQAWAQDSIFRAAAIKGGAGNILLSPLLFPFRQLFALLRDRYQLAQLVFFVVVTAITAWIAWNRDKTSKWGTWRTAAGAGALLILFVPAASRLRLNAMSITVGGLAMVAGTVLIVKLLLRFAQQIGRHRIADFNPLPLLLVLPFFQALGAAMTAAKAMPEITPAMGLMLLMLPISVPACCCGLPEVVLAAAAFILTVYGIPMKASNPYQWQYYWDAPFFVGRDWYHHPLYGPMYISTAQEQLAREMCEQIKTSGADDLLSLPNPYPNYFCGIKPWHGYVQTWYDTSSDATISQLIRDLKQQPPEWIVYQRSPEIMRLHEEVYNRGVLPHRRLDALIVERLNSGAWTIRLQQCFLGADWILIQTRPVLPGGQYESLIPSTDRVYLCSRTVHDLRMP